MVLDPGLRRADRVKAAIIAGLSVSELPQVAIDLRSGSDDGPIAHWRGSIGAEQHAISCPGRAICKTKLKDAIAF